MSRKNLSPNYFHFTDLKSIAEQSRAEPPAWQESGKILAMLPLTLASAIGLMVWQQTPNPLTPDSLDKAATRNAVRGIPHDLEPAAPVLADPATVSGRREPAFQHAYENPPAKANTAALFPPDIRAGAAWLAVVSRTALPNKIERHRSYVPQTAGNPVTRSVNEPALQLEQRPQMQRVSIEVGKGDSLSRIFNRLELDSQQAVSIADASTDKILHSLEVGRSLDLVMTESGRFVSLNYQIGALKTLRIAASANGEYTSYIDETEPRLRIRDVSTPILGNLYETAETLDISNKVVDNLNDIFRWDIDFSRDIQSGDRFSVIYEQKFLGQDYISDGDILAAEFMVKGKVTRAIRHLDDDGEARYYTPEGESLRKAFIRNPVRSARISSGFSKKRFHPVLKIWRSHKGVDYAAASGTPIMATADGVIRHIGRKGGYGKAIVIDHGQGYSTLYGHMKGYRKGMKHGIRVRQGQVIGYVGSTGMSTGPHLHYEFRVNGSHVDPLAVKLPESLPIDSRDYDEFIANARELVRRLDELQGQSIAIGLDPALQPQG